MQSCVLVAVAVCVACLVNPGVEAAVSKNVDDLKFEYYSSPLTKHQIIYNNANSLTASPFKQAARTIIIVDGFLSDGTSPMSQSTKDVYLRLNTNQNVIVLDWGKLSGSTELPLSNIISTGLTYTAALGNVGAVGERLADFCNFLRTTRGVEFSNIHIIGHSLGAHNAGAAGYFVKQKYNGLIGRITGLDPAGPMFNSQPDENKRLDKTDAGFVDIYHTNRGTLGDSSHGTGDINVYVNGGDNQPGCEDADKEGFAGYCSHSFSWELFSAAATRTFRACPCSGIQCQCADCDITCSNPITLGDGTSRSAAGAYHILTSL